MKANRQVDHAVFRPDKGPRAGTTAGSFLGKAGRALGVLGIYSSVMAVSSANAAEKGRVASSEAGSWLGSIVVGAAVGSFVCPVLGTVAGFMVGLAASVGGSILGGWVGESAYDTFQSSLDGAGLGNGGGGGDIGGVAVRDREPITLLLTHPDLHYTQLLRAVVPLYQPKLPSIYGFSSAQDITATLINEIAWCMQVEKATLLFSLHFNKAGCLYPVLHPYLQRTLTGRILGFLDYFLKGFVNGGVFSEEFLLNWSKSKNCDPNYLRANVLDIRKILRSTGIVIQYRSLREHFSEGLEDDTETERKTLKYMSAFRILGVLKHVDLDSTHLLASPDFDVEHDLIPSAEQHAVLDNMNNGGERAKHKTLEDSYEAMHHAIHEQMPLVPMFTPYFELLKFISVIVHVISTLTRMGISVCTNPPPAVTCFPDAMPPLPVRKVLTFPVKLTWGDFINQFSAWDKKILDKDFRALVYEEARMFSEETRGVVEVAVEKAIRGKLTACGHPHQDHDKQELKVEYVTNSLFTIFGHFVSNFYSDSRILELLLQIPSILNLSDYSPLLIASINAESLPEALETVLSLGASPSSVDGNGNTALDIAVRLDNLRAYQCLIEEGASLFEENREKELSIHTAAKNNSQNVLRFILQKALDSGYLQKVIEHENKEGMTPLHIAAAEGNLAAVLSLLSFGASMLAISGGWKLTASQYAAMNGHLSVARAFIALGDESCLSDPQALPSVHREAITKFQQAVKSQRDFEDDGLLKSVKKARDALDSETAVQKEEVRPQGMKLLSSPASTQKVQMEVPTLNELLLKKGMKELASRIERRAEFRAPLSLISLTSIVQHDNLLPILSKFIGFVEECLVPTSIVYEVFGLVSAEVFHPFVSLVEKSIQSNVSTCKDADIIWQWFCGYLRHPLTTSLQTVSQLKQAFEVFNKFLGLIVGLEEYVPKPVLPLLSCVNGSGSTMLVVIEALQYTKDKKMQLEMINEAPLDSEVRQQQIKSNFRFLSTACTTLTNDGLFVSSQTLNSTMKKSNSLNESIARVMCCAATIPHSDACHVLVKFCIDIQSEEHIPNDIKYLIVDPILQYLKTNVDHTHLLHCCGWGAAATHLFYQWGELIIQILVTKIQKLQFSLKTLLHICEMCMVLYDAKLKDLFSAIEAPQNDKQIIMKLEMMVQQQQRVQDKTIDILIQEMCTTQKGEIEYHRLPFDGKPLVGLPESELQTLRDVHSSMVSSTFSSNQNDLRAQCKAFGAAFKKDLSPQTAGKLIGHLSHAFYITYKIRPYLVQQMTVASFLLAPTDAKKKGRLAQVATGEGKSLIIALISAANGIQNKFVDVITSNQYLARRDEKKFRPFYQFLGLSSSTIGVPNPTTKDFNGMIIYGTNTDFEFTILREGVTVTNIQVSPRLDGSLEVRRPEVVIVDESDNLFLDAALSSARIAWESEEDFRWIYAPILSFVQSNLLSANTTQLRSFLEAHQGGIYKEDLLNISNTNLQRWIKSAHISLSKVCGEHYVVMKPSQIHDGSEDGEKDDRPRIQIMDLSTGRIQQGTQWSYGVHQFVEVREGIVPEAENLTIASISHPAFFERYQQIYGLTGTVGEPVEREETELVYGVDSFDVPPNKPCLRNRLETHIVPSFEVLKVEVLQRIKEITNQGRPILILCLTVDDSIKLSGILSQNGVLHNVLNELQHEDEEYIIFKAGLPQAVTVATNTAGRGTDILLTKEVLSAGGLHVLFSFFPENLRVECQGLGRSGRQGSPGSCEIVFSLGDPFVQSLLQEGHLHPEGSISVKDLYLLRQKHVLHNSQIRRVQCIQEKELFKQLLKFFTEFTQLKEQIQDPRFYIKLETVIQTSKESHIKGLGKLEVVQRLLSHVQNQWADSFTKMTRNGNMDEYYNEFQSTVIKIIMDIMHSENPLTQNKLAFLSCLKRESKPALAHSPPTWLSKKGEKKDENSILDIDSSTTTSLLEALVSFDPEFFEVIKLSLQSSQDSTQEAQKIDEMQKKWKIQLAIFKEMCFPQPEEILIKLLEQSSNKGLNPEQCFQEVLTELLNKSI